MAEDIVARLEGVSINGVNTKVRNGSITHTLNMTFRGDPAKLQDILMLESQHRPINAEIYSPQPALPIDE